MGVRQRVIVTGGSGFLGALVTRLLADLRHEAVVADLVAPPAGVRFIRCDVSDERVVERIKSVSADAVVRLAGVVGTAETFASPQETLRASIRSDGRMSSRRVG